MEKKEDYCPNLVTCAQKKGPNDIHEKPVEDEDDENCPKRSHVRKKKVQTIFMKNRLRMRMKMTRIVQKGHM